MIKFVRHCLFFSSEKCNICSAVVRQIQTYTLLVYTTLNSFAYLKLNIQHFIIELMNFLEVHIDAPLLLVSE